MAVTLCNDRRIALDDTRAPSRAVLSPQHSYHASKRDKSDMGEVLHTPRADARHICVYLNAVCGVLIMQHVVLPKRWFYCWYCHCCWFVVAFTIKSMFYSLDCLTFRTSFVYLSLSGTIRYMFAWKGRTLTNGRRCLWPLSQRS